MIVSAVNTGVGFITHAHRNSGLEFNGLGGDLWEVTHPTDQTLVTAWVTEVGGTEITKPQAYDYISGLLKAHRRAAEIKGVTVAGASVATDRESQAMVSGAYNHLQINPTAVLDWKGENGWVSLNAAAVTAIAQAVGNHVQGCFTTEKLHSEALGTLRDDVNTTAADLLTYNFTTGWPA